MPLCVEPAEEILECVKAGPGVEPTAIGAKAFKALFLKMLWLVE